MASPSSPRNRLVERIPSTPETLAERYVGNGQYHLPPEVYLDWIRQEVKAAPSRDEKRQVFYQEAWLPVIQSIQGRDDITFRQLIDDAKAAGAWQLESILRSMRAHQDVEDFPDPETLTALMQKNISPPNYIINPILHDGITIFAGKSKRGKSWLMLDLALAIAFGNKALRHYDTTQCPVLYLALEDGEGRIKNRIHRIYPGVEIGENFNYYLQFPSLDQHFLDILEQKINKFHFQLVIIDVLAKILPKQGNSRKNEYQDIYELFGPLQRLSKDRHIGIVCLDHLRKSESSEDKFEDIMGTTAKQGVADALWVLERKPKDSLAFLHIRDKDLEDATIGLEFKDGYWEYLGEGEEFEYDREQRQIVRILYEEGREMSVQDIMKAAGWVGEARYARLRKVLMRMSKEDLIHRARHGKYSATISGSIRYEEKDDDVPF